jgi:hypothetical protein
MHALAPANEAVLAGQAVQLVCPALAENVPAGQLVQEPPFRYWPVGQVCPVTPEHSTRRNSGRHCILISNKSKTKQ